MVLQALVDFFSTYGYAAVFLVLVACGFGVPIPEDVTLVSGGVISGLGYTNEHVMFFVGMAGVLVGDGVVFTAGRVFGQRILANRWVARILTPERFDAVRGKFERYGLWLLFAARFMPGLRTAVFMTAGITGKVPAWKFLLADGSAALISVPVWVYLGFWGANRREELLHWIKRGQESLLLALAITAVVVVLVWYVRKKYLVRLEPTESAPLPGHTGELPDARQGAPSPEATGSPASPPTKENP